jgi:hypothetical protein
VVRAVMRSAFFFQHVSSDPADVLLAGPDRFRDFLQEVRLLALNSGHIVIQHDA